jgi:dsRNA-specific ribonuclease
VYLGGQLYGRGTGRSKKEAEQQAAHEAYARFTEGDSRLAKEH